MQAGLPFDRWMRGAFLDATTALEFDAPAGDLRAQHLQKLLDGAARLPALPPPETPEDEYLRAHLHVGMLLAACTRHGVPGHDTRLTPVVDWLLEAHRRWGVAPRMLAAPYLYLNTADDGWPQTFLRSEDERCFVNANTEGLAVYEQAWTLVKRMRALGLTHPATPALLDALARTLDRLVGIHTGLGERLDHDAYFQHIRHYYEGVWVGDRHWSGVNAGDQGWSMALDLALGLAQPHPPYLAYLRDRLPYLPPSHRHLVHVELQGKGWLPALVDLAAADAAGQRLAAAALGVYDTLVRATWAHMDLAVAFIDTGPGTSGTEMRFLEETVRMRRDHPLLARLRALAA